MINASANQSATAASAAAAARPGSLLAREHGAYGQLGVPLVTALLIGGLTPGSLLLAGAAVSAFLAHEPLLVLLGHRGSRRRRLHGDRAAKRMLLLGAIFAILAGAALVLMPAPARLAAAVPALLMVVLAAFITRGRERSGAGEIVPAMALSACSLPVVMAAGRPLSVALASWLVFAAGFALVTFTVRALIARGKTKLRACAASAIFLSVLGAVLATRSLVPPAAALGLLPLCGLCLGLARCAPHPRRLRAVGWALVGGSLATAIILVLGLRL